MDSDSFLAMTELSAYAWNNDKGEETQDVPHNKYKFEVGW